MSASIHEHPEEWLAAALADDLSPEERRALDAHLAGCEPCRALQADFAALDDTLLRDFPAAVGPAVGFETRLVAGFRRRRDGRFARLNTLVGWLLRQRGAQVAGVAAALLALVEIGRLLTGGTTHANSPVASVADPEVREMVVPLDGEGFVAAERPLPAKAKSAGKDSQSPSVVPSLTAQKDSKSSSRVMSRTPYVAAVPMSDIDAGRDVTAGFGEVQIPLVGTGQKNPSESQILSQDFKLTPDSKNAYTGGTTTTNGTVAINGGMIAAHRLALLDGRRLADAGNIAGSSKKDGEFINDEDTSRRPPSPQNDAPPSSEAAAPAPDPRKLIRNARAELEVANFDAAVDAVTAAATRDGGFLDTRNAARGDNGKVSGTLVVKVMPENLDRFLAGLRTLGTVKNQTIQTEDVTKDYFDTDARLRNARRMEDRLLKMLDEVKGKMSEVLQVEKELGRVRADIEQMQGQLKLYDAEVRYATVTLSVYEKDLRQPAAFLLRETATLALLAADVERTAAEARRIADAAHAQVLHSEVSRDDDGRSRATLRLLAAPEAAADLIARIKALGRVENFHLQDERTAQNGAATDVPGAEAAPVERAPVTLDLTVSHDEQVSREIRFTLVAADAQGAFEKARAAAAAAGAELVQSSLEHTPDGHASATLGVRVPSAAAAALVATFKTLGHAGDVETRQTASGPDTGADAGPALITVNVADAEPAVQQTSVRVRTGEVERRADEIKREAAAIQAAVEASTFSSESDGRQQATLKFRLPMSAYPVFVERVRALGSVQDFTVQREDRPGTDRGGKTEASAPVVVELSLYSEGRIVGEDSGLGATLRRTFGQGAGALMWSVQMIGVALAFLAPWVVLLVVAAGAVWWRRRRRAARSRSGQEAGGPPDA